jgi:hypothetical protein
MSRKEGMFWYSTRPMPSLWLVLSQCLRGASKIKLKNVNKKRMSTARRLIFLEFLRAFIADLITLFFSSLQNSEGGGDSDSGDSFADPCQFLPFPKTKI